MANSRRWPEWEQGSEFKAVRDKTAAARRSVALSDGPQSHRGTEKEISVSGTLCPLWFVTVSYRSNDSRRDDSVSRIT